MSKKFFRKYLPTHDQIKENKHLKIFGKLHLDPNLWHFNRNSVPTAMSVGLFLAFMPIPFQTVAAVAFAIIFRCNLPISVALVWITNPFTMPAIGYFAYKVGAIFLPYTHYPTAIEFSWADFSGQFTSVLLPLLLGLFILAIVCSILGNVLVRLIWRWSVGLQWSARKKRTKNKK